MNVMRSLILFFACLSCWTMGFAQTDYKAADDYIMDPTAMAYRRKMTIPPYGLDKVKAMIEKMSFVEDKNHTDAGITALSSTAFIQLSLREKFTYVMIHAETSSQNCDIPEN